MKMGMPLRVVWRRMTSVTIVLCHVIINHSCLCYTLLIHFHIKLHYEYDIVPSCVG